MYTILTVDCGPPESPENGTVSFTSTTRNSRAMYSCNDGFTQVGSELVFCRATGSWSNVAPECVRKYSKCSNYS